MNIKRDLENNLMTDLDRYRQMLFVSGPRQSGKTTLAKMIFEKIKIGRYLNYDTPDDQVLLLKKKSFYEEIDHEKGVSPLLIFDEIHKYHHWKNYLKGIFDRTKDEFHFLVTGSGRLDLYRKGGDSLAGRYLLYHLFPLAINELGDRRLALADFLKNPADLPENAKNTWELWKSLEKLSGFPEPFLKGEETFYRRWAMSYGKQLIREDIRDLVQINLISQMENMANLLPAKVGGLLSINSLREDIRVSYETLKNWIEVLENFFLVFRIHPWSQNVARAIQKESKLYFYNWSVVTDPAACFENMVALHLYCAVNHWTEQGWGIFHLHFVRDREKNEVDFLLTKDKTPFLLIETKLGDMEPSSSLLKMGNYFNLPIIQMVNLPGISRKIVRNDRSVLIVSADRWLSSLP